VAMASFCYSHRVTYADCTIGDHIYYSRYLELLEAARGELFRHMGTTFLEWQKQDTIFPVTECRLRYKRPARYDDVLSIHVEASVAGAVRLNFAYKILDQAEGLILEGETLHACTDTKGTPKRLPKELHAQLGDASDAG